MNEAVTESKRSRRARRTQLEITPSWHELDMANIEEEIKLVQKQKAEADSEKQKGFAGSWRQQSNVVDSEVSHENDLKAIVKKLPIHVKESELKALFQNVKTLQMLNYPDGNPRGQAIITFNNIESLTLALENGTLTLEGHTLQIEKYAGMSSKYSQNNQNRQSITRNSFGKSTEETAANYSWREQLGSALQPQVDITKMQGANLDTLRDALGTCAQPEIGTNTHNAAAKTWSRTTFGLETKQPSAGLQVDNLSRDMFGKADAAVVPQAKGFRESLGRNLFGSAEPAESKAIMSKETLDFNANSEKLSELSGSWRDTKPIEQPQVFFESNKRSFELQKRGPKIFNEPKKIVSKELTKADMPEPSEELSWRTSEPLVQPEPPKPQLRVKLNRDVELKAKPVASKVIVEKPSKEVPRKEISKEVVAKEVQKKSDKAPPIVIKKREKDPYGWNTVGGNHSRNKPSTEHDSTTKNVTVKKPPKSINPYDALRN